MIITRTPFRLSLGGGGTDLPSYYRKYGGFIFAAALDKYMFINVNRPVVDDLVRLKYSQNEMVSHRDELKHEMAREALRMMGIERGIEIDSLADVPAGTGLGSSSCYAVGILNALHTLKRDHIATEALAVEANRLETEILRWPAGKQDHYAASFGGLVVLKIDTEGHVVVERPQVPDDVIDALNTNTLMFYTNTARTHTNTTNSSILVEQSQALNEQKKDVVESMHFIKELGYKILEAVESGNLTDVGLHFDTHWQHKKKISSRMSNPRFDEIYRIAKESGALGGKITGTGGGGFFTFYVENNHLKFRRAMREAGLREMKYRFDFEGSKVLLNF